MSQSPRPPEELPEGELFTEYVRLLDGEHSPTTGYDRAKLEERRARVLAEIGERLETLEAVKALIETTDADASQRRTDGDRTIGASEPTSINDE